MEQRTELRARVRALVSAGRLWDVSPVGEQLQLEEQPPSRPVGGLRGDGPPSDADAQSVREPAA
jgi:hypothetical protein